MRRRRLLGAVVYIACVALFVEIALQLFYYVTAGDFLFTRVALPIYVSDARSGFANRPGLALDHHTNEFHARYYNNSAGFRVSRPGLEYARSKPEGTFRILLLGPSFAYGWGVDYEQSFAGVLERLLAERGFAGPERIELIDAGIPAMPPAPQLAWFEAVGAGYRPDLVIQLVAGSMAVSSDARPEGSVDADGYLVRANLTTERRWRERVKKSASVFYGWLLWSKLRERLAGEAGDRAGGRVQGAGREMVEAAVFDPASPEVRDALALYEQLARAVGDAGARLLVVHIPLSYAVHAEDESRWRHLGVHDAGRQVAFDAAFVRHLSEHAIPALDVTQPLREAAAQGQRTYFWLDIHWTPAGNAVAASAVAEYMLRGEGRAGAATAGN